MTDISKIDVEKVQGVINAVEGILDTLNEEEQMFVVECVYGRRIPSSHVSHSIP